MPKFDIQYACSHTVETEIKDDVKDIEGRREWLTAKDCPACYKTKIEAEAIEATKDWPELAGTAKMVPWATKIRGEKVAKVLRMREPDQALIKAYKSMRDAGWYLNNRSTRVTEDLALIKQYKEIMKDPPSKSGSKKEQDEAA